MKPVAFGRASSRSGTRERDIRCHHTVVKITAIAIASCDRERAAPSVMDHGSETVASATSVSPPLDLIAPMVRCHRGRGQDS